MFSNFVYPAQVFIYSTIAQVCIYAFMQAFVLAGFYTDIMEAIERKRFSQFFAYFILILFAIIIKVIIFVGIITTLTNAGANDLANVVGIVYPVILTICVFALGIYQLWNTYITKDLESKITLNKYIQDYTFGGKDFNVYDTDATSQDKKRVEKAYEDWMKKSSFGTIYKKDNYFIEDVSAAQKRTKLTKLNTEKATNVLDVCGNDFETWFGKADISAIFIPETVLSLKDEFILYNDISYITISGGKESSAAAKARQYYVKLKKEVAIQDDTYLNDIKQRYQTSPYTNMQGYSNIEGYSGVQGFSNYV